MASPYEDFEQIADFLPSEGRAVILFRENGELHAEPYAERPDEATFDDMTMGALLVANTKLDNVGTHVVWGVGVGLFVLLGVCWKAFEMGAAFWWLHVALTLGAFFVYTRWVESQEAVVFRREVLPLLQDIQQMHCLNDHALLAVLTTYGDLRDLAEEYRQFLAHRGRLAQAGASEGGP